MTRATIGGVSYEVRRPLNESDMNFHFIDENNVDHLVDLEDVIDWKYADVDEDDATGTYGANYDDAINYATEISNMSDDGVFWWKIAGK